MTPEAKTILQENINEMFSKRSAITTWLENERKQDVFIPEITPEVINTVDSEEYHSIEDLMQRVLSHFGRGGLGDHLTLRDDRALAEKNLDILRNSPGRIVKLFEDARIMAGSGCKDWNELGVIMDDLERTGWVRKSSIADSAEWHNYSLTLEGLREASKIDAEQGSSGNESRQDTENHREAAASDVFVIHGRNEEARIAISDFLIAIGLNPIQWETAVKETGQTSPYVGPIINAGLSRAHAAIVILTPDDRVTLSPALQRPDDPPMERQSERQSASQPRPNVIFEAGMAMCRFEERTVIVEIGEIKRWSDMIGRHTVRLADTVYCRQVLASRLQVAGCPVDLSQPEWEKAGNFSDAIRKATECLGGSNGGAPDEIDLDAVTLLRHAAGDEAHRPIAKLETPYGTLISAGPFTFGGNGDERETRRWEMALERLLCKGLLEFTGASAVGAQYLVTPGGQTSLNELAGSGFE